MIKLSCYNRNAHDDVNSILTRDEIVGRHLKSLYIMVKKRKQLYRKKEVTGIVTENMFLCKLVFASKKLTHDSGDRLSKLKIEL